MGEKNRIEVKIEKKEEAWHENILNQSCMVCHTLVNVKEDKNYYFCEVCINFLEGYLVQFCMNCENVQFILKTEVLRKMVDKYREEGRKVDDIFKGTTIVYYGACPKCMNK